MAALKQALIYMHLIVMRDPLETNQLEEFSIKFMAILFGMSPWFTVIVILNRKQNLETDKVEP